MAKGDGLAILHFFFFLSLFSLYIYIIFVLSFRFSLVFDFNFLFYFVHKCFVLSLGDTTTPNAFGVVLVTPILTYGVVHEHMSGIVSYTSRMGVAEPPLGQIFLSTFNVAMYIQNSNIDLIKHY